MFKQRIALSLALLGSATAIECPVPRQRKAWDTLSSDEQLAFLDAVKALKEHDGSLVAPYDDFVRVHRDNSAAAHGEDEFLPWHRWYIWQYETALQTVANNCSITLPYWRWENDSGNEDASAPLDPNTFGSVTGFQKDGKGNGPTVDYDVTEGIAACSDGAPFNTTVWTGECLERDFAGTGTFSSQTVLINLILGNSDYNNFRPSLEGTPHAVPHTFVGRHMSSYHSPDDPLFFIHHCNVDRIWALWQDYYGHDGMDPNSLGTNEFSSNHTVDVEMAFSITGGGALNNEFFEFTSAGAYPTPRDVILNDDNIKVTYVQDSLAQVLVSTTAPTAIPYTPNPDWFTTSTTTATTMPTTSPTTAATTAVTTATTTTSCIANGIGCDAGPCCGKCRNGVCRGGRRLGEPEQDERKLRKEPRPPVWANPAAQHRWDELVSKGIPPQAAIHTMVREECGQNEIQVSREWMNMFPLDDKYFRCYVE